MNRDQDKPFITLILHWYYYVAAVNSNPGAECIKKKKKKAALGPLPATVTVVSFAIVPVF